MNDEKDKKSKPASLWTKGYLYVQNRTSGRVSMLQTKDMKVVEADDDLPSADSGISHAEKYSQIGPAAFHSLLSSAMQNIPGDDTAFIVIDLSPKLGDLARAVLTLGEGSMPLHYLAVAPDSQMEWAHDDLEETIVNMFLGRTLKIKDKEPLPENMSATDTPELTAPQLTIGHVEGVNLILPGTLGAKWSASSFKDEWEALLEEKENLIPNNQDDNLVQPKAKRMRLDQPASQSETAGADSRAALVHVSKLDVTKMLLQAAGVGKLKGLTFQLFPGNLLYLLNSTAADINACGFLCGWQKGKWWSKENAPGAGEIDSSVDLVWKFTNSSEIVILDNVCQTLYSIMEKQKSTAPEKALLRFHKLKDDPEGSHGPGDFQIEMVHEVAWRAERVTVAAGPGSKQNPATLAALLPADCWDPASCVLTWHTRWAKQGLTGVKPVVHLKQNVVISPEHALKLTIGEA